MKTQHKVYKRMLSFLLVLVVAISMTTPTLASEVSLEAANSELAEGTASPSIEEATPTPTQTEVPAATPIPTTEPTATSAPTPEPVVTPVPIALVGVSISKAPSKTSYWANEKFSKTGMVITANYSDGSKRIVTDYSYSPSGALKTSDKAIKITYKEGSVAVTATQKIAVKAKLTSVKITKAPSKTTYWAKEKFSKTGMTVTAYYNDGSKKAVTNYSYSPSGALKTSDKAIKITYKENSVTASVTQKINVKAKLTDLKITKAPTKKTYYTDQKFSKTGMVVTAYYNDGSKKAVTGYSVSPSGYLKISDKSVKLTYKEGSISKNVTQKISVKAAALTGIKITKKPSKTTYYSGQKFSKSGMVVTAYYNSGNKKAITKYSYSPSGALKTGDKAIKITNYSYSPSGALKTGDKAIKITYKEGKVSKSTSVAISVKAVALSSIKVTKKPSKSTYYAGDKFSKSGMVVTAYYNNGAKKTVSNYSYSPSSALKTSDKAIKITYKEGKITKTASLPISVKALALSSIKVTKAPSKTSYYVGQKFSKTGMVVTAYYNSGAKKTITNYSYSPSGALKTSDKKITVTYRDGSISKSASVSISVKSVSLSSIKITKNPSKTSYVAGEKFSKNGMTVTAYYNNGNKKAITNYGYSPSGALKTSDKKITVTYKEGNVSKSISLPITVKADSNPARQALNSAPLKPQKTGYKPMDDVLDKIFASIIKPGMSTYDKVRACYDYLIKRYSYGPSGKNEDAFDAWHNIPCKLIGNSMERSMVTNSFNFLSPGVTSGVCDNYNSAFALMMRKIGLESYVIGGTLEGDPHLWCEIKINGDYWIFDPQVEDKICNGQSAIGSKTGSRCFYTKSGLCYMTYSPNPSRSSQLRWFFNFE